jgi:hypothetical protein
VTAELGQILSGGTEIVVGNGRPPMGGSGPVERTQIARPVLPCDRCSHRVVCAIKPRLEAAAIEVHAPAAPDPNVTISVSVTLTCAFFADDGSPVENPAPRIITGLEKRKADRDHREALIAKSVAMGERAGPPPAGTKRRHSPETIEKMRASARARALRRGASTEL